MDFYLAQDGFSWGWVDLAGGLKPPRTPPMAPGGAPENESTSMGAMGTWPWDDGMASGHAGPRAGPMAMAMVHGPWPWAMAMSPCSHGRGFIFRAFRRHRGSAGGL